MNSNTEFFANIAEQIAAHLKTVLGVRTLAGESVRLPEVEIQLRDSLRQIGAQALGKFLQSGLGTPAAEIECECGGWLQYQRRRPAVVLSVFGRVDYQRAYYAGCQCGQGKAR